MNSRSGLLPFVVSAFTLAFAACVTNSSYGQVHAQTADRGKYTISSSTELFSDGVVIGREVHCACVTEDDRITVYRVSGSDPISPTLDQDTDFDGTVWLFDSGNQGQEQIVVRFHRPDGRLTADIYQDQDGDGSVAHFRLDDGDISILETGFASMRVVAVGDYWQRDGRMAASFGLPVDDRVGAAVGSVNYSDAVANDGIAAVSVRVRGPRVDDPRSYDWRSIYSPVPSSTGIIRTEL